MSKTAIPSKVVLKLWMRSGGRCQFRGCNQVLWRDELTQREMNNAYIAHIVADRPDGPRGNSVLSPKLAKEFNNLMLLCPTHHKLVDSQPEDYSVDLLQAYKREHEERIEHLTSINEDMKTHLLVFIGNIGDRKPSISFDEARIAVLPHYPAESRFIEIDLTHGPYKDYEFSYFTAKQDEISRLIESRIRQRSHCERINHLSVFALASIPLLIHFGYELGEATPSEIYHCHRDTHLWKWEPLIDGSFRYMIEAPDLLNVCNVKAVAINLSLSGVIHTEEIAEVMTEPYCIYTMSIAEPSRDYLRSKEQLDLFKAEMRVLLRQIRQVHAINCEIHLFSAIPAPVAVSLGQLFLPKSDPPMHIYEHNQRNGGFRYALTIPRRRYERT
jgi:hypothetical protein